MILVLQICAVRFSTKMIWLILLRRRVQIAPCIFISNKFRIILIFNSYALFSTFSHANGHTCVRLTYLRLKLHTSQRERITYPDKTYFFELNPKFCVSFVISLRKMLKKSLLIYIFHYKFLIKYYDFFSEWENSLDIFYSNMFSTYDRNWKEIKPEARKQNFVSDLNKKGSEKMA